jgi:hypothetical protein
LRVVNDGEVLEDLGNFVNASLNKVTCEGDGADRGSEEDDAV